MLEDISRSFPHLSETPVLAVTLVDPQDKRAPGELHTFDLGLMVRRTRKLLERINLPGVVVFGAVDFSLNVNNTDDHRWQDHWMPHVHLLIIGTTRDTLRAALSPHLKRDRTVKRPLHIRDLGASADDVVRRTSYGFKSVFYRVSYFVGRDHGVTCHNKRALSNDSLAELAAYLDRWPPTARLVLRTVRRHGWHLVLRLPKAPE